VVILEAEELSEKPSMVKRRSTIDENIQQILKNKQRISISPGSISCQFENIEEKVLPY
jgi:hypothetical protein